MVDRTKDMTLLFEAKMIYDPDLEAITSAEGRPGEYIGSGSGTVMGSRLQGTMRWDLYEEISDQACRTNFAGRLTTEDGVEITFDAVGFGLVPDAEKAQRWYMAYAVHFQSSASKYGWLSAVLGLWEGWLDMQSYTHHYQVFANETLLPSQ